MQWSDGTSFDFGANIAAGLNPWANDLNWDRDPSCAKLDWNADPTFAWQDGSCSMDRYAVCNMPSEVCYSNQWSELYNHNIVWDIQPCEMVLNYADVSVLIMSQNTWVNKRSKLVIEMSYKLNDIQTVSDGGIVMYDSDVHCNRYYYVGITLNDTNGTVFIAELLNDEYYMLTSMPLSFVYDSGTFYTLRIEANSTLLLVYLNENEYLRTDIFEGQLFNTTESPFIGIRNTNSSMTVKSLFISGTKTYKSSANINDWFNECNVTNAPTVPTSYPSNNPTISPIFIPTVSPSTYPSKYPTVSPSKYPTISPSNYPTVSPSKYPTVSPTNIPSNSPTNVPSKPPSLYLRDGGVSAESTIFTTTENDSFYAETIYDDLTVLTIILAMAIVILLAICALLCVYLCLRHIRKKKAGNNGSVGIQSMEMKAVNVTVSPKITEMETGEQRVTSEGDLEMLVSSSPYALDGVIDGEDIDTEQLYNICEVNTPKAEDNENLYSEPTDGDTKGQRPTDGNVSPTPKTSQ